MDISKFAETPRPHAVAISAAWLGQWAANMIWAREALSSIPAEGSPCLQGDEVARARQLLLGQERSENLTG